jgi:hypothetical protein
MDSEKEWDSSEVEKCGEEEIDSDDEYSDFMRGLMELDPKTLKKIGPTVCIVLGSP